MRIIARVDMDAFYVAVEERGDPALLAEQADAIEEASLDEASLDEASLDLSTLDRFGWRLREDAR